MLIVFKLAHLRSAYQLPKTSKSKINESFIERYKSSYLSELEHFYKSIINKSKSTVGPENILNAIRVASAGNESIKTNKPVLVEK